MPAACWLGREGREGFAVLLFAERRGSGSLLHSRRANCVPSISEPTRDALLLMCVCGQAQSPSTFGLLADSTQRFPPRPRAN